jgi:hypothetical protein
MNPYGPGSLYEQVQEERKHLLQEAAERTEAGLPSFDTDPALASEYLASTPAGQAYARQRFEAPEPAPPPPAPRPAPLDQLTDCEIARYPGGKVAHVLVRLESRDSEAFVQDLEAVDRHLDELFNPTVERFRDTPEYAVFLAARQRLQRTRELLTQQTEAAVTAESAYQSALDSAADGEASRTYQDMISAAAVRDATRKVVEDLQAREYLAGQAAFDLLSAALKENRFAELRRVTERQEALKAELIEQLKAFAKPYDHQEGIAHRLGSLSSQCERRAQEFVRAVGKTSEPGK